MPDRLAGLRILVVDDNPVHGEAAALLLRRAAGEVEWAANGESALAKLRVFRPDVVLIDCRLPDMTGFQLWRRIATAPELQGIAAVAFTAAPDGDPDVDALAAEGVPVVHKPAGLTTLAGAISGAAAAGGWGGRRQ